MLTVKDFEFNMFGEKTYVVFDPLKRECAVVDPGMMNAAECARFGHFIEEQELKVKYLVATHLHIDHLMGLEYIENSYNVGLSASPLDVFLGERLKWQAEMFHLPVKVPDQIVLANPLEPGDELPLGDDALEVLAVPGHSPGSIALYSRMSEFVLVGDALFRGSIGRTDLPGGDYATLVKSIGTTLGALPPQTKVYSGHGPSTTIAHELATNPFL